MQTFLPYSNFRISAKCLDYRRLGKQRVEARQIIEILDGFGKVNKNGNVSWSNHPAVKMWKGYENALKQYYNEIVIEWISRGYKNNMPMYLIPKNIEYPPWFGNKYFHAAHRSNLLRKNRNYYSQYSWTEPTDMNYIWPTERY